jgi:hypothetical protein
MTEKSSPQGPCKLAGGGRRSSESCLGRHRLGEREIDLRVKEYSGSHLIQSNLIPRICLTDGSDMFDGLRLDNLLSRAHITSDLIGHQNMHIL